MDEGCAPTGMTPTGRHTKKGPPERSGGPFLVAGVASVLGGAGLGHAPMHLGKLRVAHHPSRGGL